ncbi:DUF3618 domain-containing protein [Amycolatopsis jiangsuensis]|uniref:DUF3618 domain-containing protein n=1 Tax=Amycolatopsis jiangsuensis TaxID=1181879 RepID=A0A840INL9_9PSEU|nr:DUF3618 domain-containing protein [Amycolatopsis jiangsuensis]MBB4684021.1 hypothetical protein [Amycolatopsis jiangsuensis]
MTERETAPTDAERARADRDVTREELAETIDALGHKLDVRTRASERVDATIEQATAGVEDKISAPAARKFRSGAEAVRDNPLPIFGAVLGGLLVIRLLVRRRSRARTDS